MGNGWGNFLFHTNSSGVVSAGVTNNSDSRIDSAADVLVVDEWQHFAFTLNDRHAKLYRNGELLGEKTNSWRLESSLGHFEIGKAGASTIDGHIDEVRIWSTARTQQEIRDNMHNVLLGNETGLKLYLQFYAAAGGATDLSNACYAIETHSDPRRTVSTAPAGTVGEFVNTTTQTSTGDAGKQLAVEITSVPSGTDYLGIYRAGAGDSTITSGETFPAGLTKRADIFWGVHEYGDVTATLVFDYSNVAGINAAGAQLLKRADAATAAWTNVTADFTHDPGSFTFTRTGVTDFSEFSVGDICTAAATPTNTGIALSGVGNVDVALSWDDDPANTGGYEIHRGTSPYFVPDAGSLLATEPAGATAHTDAGAAGAANPNHYYVVRGLSNCGEPSAYEKRLGEFDFGLVPGS